MELRGSRESNLCKLTFLFAQIGGSLALQFSSFRYSSKIRSEDGEEPITQKKQRFVASVAFCLLFVYGRLFVLRARFGSNRERVDTGQLGDF